MPKISPGRGSALAGMLAAALTAILLFCVCLYGIAASLNLLDAAAQRSGADTLAALFARQIRERLRYARDPAAAIAELSDDQAELAGMRTENLTFETSPDGQVTFRFTVVGYGYTYTVLPLNFAYDPE